MFAAPNRPLQPIKLLIQREDYTTCHIAIPGDTQRLAAIALSHKFYSFFRAPKEATKALGLLLKLAARGNQTAFTLTAKGYAIWVHEPDAVLAGLTPQDMAQALPTLVPADCWIIGDRQPGYRACSLQVTDLPEPVRGLSNHQGRLYSLYRRANDAGQALKVAARLCRRRDEVVMVVGKTGYILCVYEPNATILP